MLHHLFHRVLIAPVARRLWLTLPLLGSLPTAEVNLASRWGRSGLLAAGAVGWLAVS